MRTAEAPSGAPRGTAAWRRKHAHPPGPIRTGPRWPRPSRSWMQPWPSAPSWLWEARDLVDAPSPDKARASRRAAPSDFLWSLPLPATVPGRLQQHSQQSRLQPSLLTGIEEQFCDLMTREAECRGNLSGLRLKTPSDHPGLRPHSGFGQRLRRLDISKLPSQTADDCSFDSRGPVSVELTPQAPSRIRDFSDSANSTLQIQAPGHQGLGSRHVGWDSTLSCSTTSSELYCTEDPLSRQALPKSRLTP